MDKNFLSLGEILTLLQIKVILIDIKIEAFQPTVPWHKPIIPSKWILGDKHTVVNELYQFLVARTFIAAAISNSDISHWKLRFKAGMTSSFIQPHHLQVSYLWMRLLEIGLSSGYAVYMTEFGCAFVGCSLFGFSSLCCLFSDLYLLLRL